MTPIELDDLHAKALARPGGNVIVPSEQLAAIIAGLREAREAMAKLPRTADGVPIVPGMELWANVKAYATSQWIGVARMSDFFLEVSKQSIPLRDCYSTEAAAIAARPAAAEGETHGQV